MGREEQSARGRGQGTRASLPQCQALGHFGDMPHSGEFSSWWCGYSHFIEEEIKVVSKVARLHGSEPEG